MNDSPTPSQPAAPLEATVAKALLTVDGARCPSPLPEGRAALHTAVVGLSIQPPYSNTGRSTPLRRRNITFDGFVFRGARGAGIVLRDSHHVVVGNGAITDCGMTAFNVRGGAGCAHPLVDLA
jgi:hypothetical protein